MVENIDTEAADLSQLVKSQPGNPQKKLKVPEVEVPQLKAPQYEDPIEQTYHIDKKNRIGSIENRESEEGIATMHKSIHVMG
jgi:hypothetical protein